MKCAHCGKETDTPLAHRTILKELRFCSNECLNKEFRKQLYEPGDTLPCERCKCCRATLTICQECQGAKQIKVETDIMPSDFDDQAAVLIQCPSCEGEGSYWFCSCNDFGVYHESTPK